MPRGRHRHSPPLHRLLPPSAIAGVSLVCAFGPWVFTQSSVLRVIAAFAAATAVVGAAVMRRWDAQAGKQVADLTRARASDDWRHEERIAELETDLDESRELRTKLEQRLRGKRAELAGLRNEHAALLRRYATAETERASALEGRRLLEIEAADPAPELADADDETAENAGSEAETEAVAASVDADELEDAELAEGVENTENTENTDDSDTDDDDDEKPAATAVFSPEGSHLFLRAKAALKKFDGDADGSPKDDDAATAEDDEDEAEDELEEAAEAEADAEVVEAEDGSQDDAAPQGDAVADEDDDEFPEDDDSPKGDGPTKGRRPAKREPVKAKAGAATAAAGPVAAAPEAAAGSGTEAAAQEDEAQGKPEAVDGHERATAGTSVRPAQSAPVQQPSGHFVAPTAVAVVPATPVRRPSVEGGFDFFGTKSEIAHGALDVVQNEDLADVVGHEALALHKAEAEAEFKPADEQSRGIGQVIDLTAHDETEQIDLQGLRTVRSAVS
ncbi:hypothetical protein [Streptomyces pseudovenezuelae]|uniref:Secreted protein n=1 Tax=Streptomyces pseudovenezuelae TaxID=67350 RepID=A0ABT6LE44_9ACTN|nr:hypothetical protein [Streptomyces pseudovenezuelae]MDH6214577.1 hypothetical protein [Streptomyces pseudovenezuelae]